MVDVISKRCVGGCGKQPNYNVMGEKKRLYCRDCKLDGMVNIAIFKRPAKRGSGKSKVKGDLTNVITFKATTGGTKKRKKTNNKRTAHECEKLGGASSDEISSSKSK
eukprot:Pgem_evm1s14927